MIPKDIDTITNGWQVLVVLAIVTVPSIGGWVAAARIKHQSKPNSGNSMKDSLNRIEEKVDAHGEKIDGLTERVATLEHAAEKRGRQGLWR